MVTISIDNCGYNGHILLEPNLSLSWKTNTRLFIVICLITLIISGYFFSIGGWMVLPFSGAELFLIAISTYLFFSRNNHREVITFTSDKVVIERGKRLPETTREYQRHWSKIHVQEHGLYNIPRVSIKSHGKETELGAFLGYDDKMLFINTLENITRRFQTRH
ncbi:MAG: DUF2244 domain-containing protein [Gammaproteobacteria bacterium]|nr:MAG: DUF2244 domain-containing protein [Gammaproteobacteria bacterium]